jgi:hypothetical protein
MCDPFRVETIFPADAGGVAPGHIGGLQRPNLPAYAENRSIGLRKLRNDLVQHRSSFFDLVRAQ